MKAREFKLDEEGMVIPEGLAFSGDEVLIFDGRIWVQVIWLPEEISKTCDGTEYDGYCFIDENGTPYEPDDISYWCPLPELPKDQ